MERKKNNLKSTRKCYKVENKDSLKMKISTLNTSDSKKRKSVRIKNLSEKDTQPKKNEKKTNINDENKNENLNKESNQITSLITKNDFKINLKSNLNLFELEFVDSWDYSDIIVEDKILPIYEEEKKKLFNIIDNSLVKGNSSSCVIIGSFGTGKTELVNFCLREKAQDAHKIELHGKFDTSYEKIISIIGSYLDINKPDFSSIMNQLKINSTKKTQKLVFVLDYFEDFCTKTQLLIYNLFNCLQHINNILIICTTTRYDCFELIEKRVKSRMNFKTIYLSGPWKNLKEFIDFSLQLLNKNIKLTKQFYNSLENQYSMSNSINQLKECLSENIRLNNLEININKNIIKLLPHTDATIHIICTNLSKLDFCVLLICAKIVYIKKIEHFNFNFILNYKDKIPSQFTGNRKKIINSICNLIDKGLIVKDEIKSESNSFFTEFTSLKLNVFKSQIEESIKVLDNKLSHYIKEIYSVHV